MSDASATSPDQKRASTGVPRVVGSLLEQLPVEDPSHDLVSRTSQRMREVRSLGRKDSGINPTANPQ